MKTKLRFIIIVCLSALLVSISTKSVAQNGPNLLSNYNFANMTDFATSTTGVTFSWPDDWVYVGESLLFNNYPVFKVTVNTYPPDETLYPSISCWTGVTSSAKMYQDITGLTNGTYEFALDASCGGMTGDSHYYIYATNFGGDSISVEMKDGKSSGYTHFTTGPIHVTNGKCRVGLYVTNGNAGNYTDMIGLSFHTTPTTSLELNLASKIAVTSTNGKLNVVFKEGKINSVEVYNVSGKLISSSKGVDSSIFTENLNVKGLNLIKVTSSIGVLTTKVLNK